MIRAIRPSAVAHDDASIIAGWNIAPNVGYTVTLSVSASAVVAIMYSADGSTLIGSGVALVGTDQPVTIHPVSGQTIGTVDADLGWHLLVTTAGTEGERSIVMDPMVDLADEIHPIYTDDGMALARATAAINAGASYVDDVSVVCPLGLGAAIGDVVGVPVNGSGAVGQVESVTWSGTPDGTIETAVIRRHTAIAPAAYTPPPAPPVLADDTAETDAATATSGNVLTNDTGILTVVAVNGLSANVGQPVMGSNGGVFTITSNGAWTFDPDGDFGALTGSETAETSATYHASDGVSEAMAKLTITVISGAAPELWTPADITTSLWLDSADAPTVTLVDGTVSQWADKSGNLRHVTQGTSAARPVVNTSSQNGLDVISFDGSDDRLVTSQALLSGAYTIIVCARNRILSKTAWLVGQGTTGGAGRQYITAEYGTTQCIHQINNGAQTVSGTPAGGHKIYAVTRNGTASAVKINGGVAVAGTVDANTVQNTAFTVGGAVAGSGALDVCELIVANSALILSEIQKIEGYLAHKWGLAASLPSNHPYKSTPPYVE